VVFRDRVKWTEIAELPFVKQNMLMYALTWGIEGTCGIWEKSCSCLFYCFLFWLHSRESM